MLIDFHWCLSEGQHRSLTLQCKIHLLLQPFVLSWVSVRTQSKPSISLSHTKIVFTPFFGSENAFQELNGSELKKKNSPLENVARIILHSYGWEEKACEDLLTSINKHRQWVYSLPKQPKKYLRHLLRSFYWSFETKEPGARLASLKSSKILKRQRQAVCNGKPRWNRIMKYNSLELLLLVQKSKTTTWDVQNSL